MSTPQRRPSGNMARSEAERFLDKASPYLRDARIKGIRDMKTVQAFLKYEHENQHREDVIEMLKDQLLEIRPSQ